MDCYWGAFWQETDFSAAKSLMHYEFLEIDMRWIFNISMALYFIFSMHSVNAASGIGKGQVEFARTHDGTTPAPGSGWSSPRFWFTLKGVTGAGTCNRWASGTVLFVANDKQMLAFILTAQATGQEIAVYWDDAVLTNGYCTAQFITIGAPAPAY